MRKRLLGKTGIEVSEIAFGGVEIGLPYGIGVVDASDMLSEDQAVELLRTSLDSGINFFDTARMYGTSELLMGKAFLDCRQEVVLCTKCRHLRDASGKLPPDDHMETFIQASLHESLTALQTDHVEVFMLHQADSEILANQAIADVFSKLKKEGIISATGVSTYSVEDTRQALTAGAWDVIQFPYNLLDQRQGEVFEEAAQRGVGLVVRSVLMKGLLSSRGKNLHPALSEVEAHIEGYQALLTDDFSDLPALATKFALSQPEVAAVLVGIDRMQYLHEALRTADGRYMNTKQLATAHQYAYPQPEFLDLHQWDLQGWLT